MNTITLHWKTTLMGTLVLLIAAFSSIHFDSSGHLAMTTQNWFTLAGGLLAQALAMFQKDAGTTLAITPGSVTPEPVPSHEVPDAPAARAVLPEVKK
jgi:hypothetical protein